MESFDTKFCIPSIWKHSMFLAPRVDSWGIVPEWIIFHTELLRRHDTFSRTHCKGEKIQNNEVNRIFKSFFFNFFPLAQFIFRNVDFVKKCLSDRRLYRFLVIYFLFFTKKCSIGAKICQDFFFLPFPLFSNITVYLTKKMLSEQRFACAQYRIFFLPFTLFSLILSQSLFFTLWLVIWRICLILMGLASSQRSPIVAFVFQSTPRTRTLNWKKI